jgi:dephospho-CoA kinase
VKDGAVDRAALSAAVVGKPAEIKKLETIVHPLVGHLREDFLCTAEAGGAEMAVLEIQMLLEGSGATQLDVIVVVSAPEVVQRERALARPGMTEQKLAGFSQTRCRMRKNAPAPTTSSTPASA